MRVFYGLNHYYHHVLVYEIEVENWLRRVCWSSAQMSLIPAVCGRQQLLHAEAAELLSQVNCSVRGV